MLDSKGSGTRQLALFNAERPAPELDCEVVQVRLNELSLHRPRQWGGCWLALALWDRLAMDGFWAEKTGRSHKGTRRLNVLKVLVCQRLLEPGSEWRLHRQRFDRTALADLLGEGIARWRKRTRCTAAWTGCCPTSRRFSTSSPDAGRACSMPASTCCCTTGQHVL